MDNLDSQDRITFRPEGHNIELEVQLEGETVWLTQKQMSSLFDKDVRTINEHIQSIYAEGELQKIATIRKFRIVRLEDIREVTRRVGHYNLDVIISVGYRVKSLRGTQFRIWATKLLKQHLVQGYTLNKQVLLESQKYKDLQIQMQNLRKVLENETIALEEAKGLIRVITDYAQGLNVLEEYDRGDIQVIQNATRISGRLLMMSLLLRLAGYELSYKLVNYLGKKWIEVWSQLY